MLLREIPARQPSASRGLATSQQQRELAALTRDVSAPQLLRKTQDRPVVLGYILALLATRAFGVLKILIDYWNQISADSLRNTPL